MNWLRNRLCAWLGITWLQLVQKAHEDELGKLQHDNAVLAERILELSNQPTLADVSRKQFEIENALRELKELRAEILDPKRQPIKTTRFSQFRAVMEQEP